MTNKELFKLLNKEQQLEVVKTLSCYRDCDITFYNGEYHIETSVYLLSKYPDDFKSFKNTFKNTEFYSNTMWYHNAWYDFIEARKAKGETNHDGHFQKEFEENFAKPIYEKAIKDYLEGEE